MMKKLLILPPVLIGIALLFFAIRGSAPPEQAAVSERATAVRVVAVQPVAFRPRILGYGTVEPARIWHATAELAGQIEYINPKLRRGAIMRRDETLIRIARADYEIARDRANADLAKVVADLAEMEQAEANARQSLKIEEDSLAASRRELERQRQLVERGVSAQRTLDEQERAYLTQRARTQDVRSTISLYPSQRQALTAERARLAAAVRQAEVDLDRTIIRAPFDGRVAEVNVEESQYVTVGEVTAKLDDIRSSEIDAQIPQSRMQALMRVASPDQAPAIGTAPDLAAVVGRLGLVATVRLTVGERVVEWPGDVVRISDTVNPQTRTVGTIIQVNDTYALATPGTRPPLIKGMFVEVELATGPVAEAFVVPRSALVEGRLFVATAENRLEIRDVGDAEVFGNAAIVTGFVSAGERVVTSRPSPAIPGMLLKPYEDGAGDAPAGGVAPR
ncbi:MAG: HlyD family efflux transporter periplasmic adaptor subunit [Rhodospirillales bacterium]